MGKVKTYSFGGCTFSKINPNISAGPKVLNVIISFAEALKLNLALDESLRKLNKYNLKTKAGKRAAVNLIIHVKPKNIAIAEAKLTK